MNELDELYELNVALFQARSIQNKYKNNTRIKGACQHLINEIEREKINQFGIDAAVSKKLLKYS